MTGGHGRAENGAVLRHSDGERTGGAVRQAEIVLGEGP